MNIKQATETFSIVSSSTTDASPSDLCQRNDFGNNMPFADLCFAKKEMYPLFFNEGKT